jgi:hypothetical protein
MNFIMVDEDSTDRYWFGKTNSTYRDEDSAVALDKWIAYENEQAAGSSSSDSAGDSTGARSEYSDDVGDDNERDDDDDDGV